ncbi:hypothetical protein TIFTF001_026850 [Ficus carica]|uniref:Uncharacterized protein n=1 Tax=Ficus carica TaxID=3494 RepID=A0AA88DM05_FICCA|nr:hypothetical protein TIFTF001_026850 [Ficus carica]
MPTILSVVCHEVPMDKGTSESSLLGAGSPLPCQLEYYKGRNSTREVLGSSLCEFIPNKANP